MFFIILIILILVAGNKSKDIKYMPTHKNIDIKSHNKLVLKNCKIYAKNAMTRELNTAGKIFFIIIIGDNL